MRLREGGGRWSLAAFVVVAFATTLLTAGCRAEAAAEVCNGSSLLCDRPFNEVVFPATHNSMAAASGGYLWPYQQGGIAEQLRFGIRVFLIDTHYWNDNAEAEAFASRLSPEAAATVRATEVSAGTPIPGTYLCHMACALGHTSLTETLTTLREFLDAHPHEVMAIFFQDGISVPDTVAAFHASGLDSYVYTHRPGSEWPTLRRLIHHHHQLLVMGETGGPPPAWYHQGWTLAQDTRFDVPDSSAFNCALNRGAITNDLFLLNNWVARLTPRVSDAERVNSYDFLLGRAQRCMAERGRVPNFIAVNFCQTGDLLRVVDTLNGVSSGPAPSVR
jgi:hypothetical protein